MILLTTVGISYPLKYLGHVIYVLQTSMYHNIAKLLTWRKSKITLTECNIFNDYGWQVCVAKLLSLFKNLISDEVGFLFLNKIIKFDINHFKVDQKF